MHTIFDTHMCQQMQYEIKNMFTTSIKIHAKSNPDAGTRSFAN